MEGKLKGINITEYSVPRPFIVWIFQFSFLFAVIFGLCFPLFDLAFGNWDFDDFIFVFIAITIILLPFLIIAYLPELYRHRLIIDKDKLVLIKVTRRKDAKTYNLKNIDGIILQRLLEPAYCECKLILSMNDGQSVELINQSACKMGKHWELFCKDLAEQIEKPLKIETWRIDYDGEKRLANPATEKHNYHINLGILIILLIITFFGALVFRFFPTMKMFITIGFIIILINTAISLYAALRSKDLFEKSANRKAMIISLGLGSVVSSFLLYLLFAYSLTTLITILKS